MTYRPKWERRDDGNWWMVSYVERAIRRSDGDQVAMNWCVSKFFGRWRISILRTANTVELGHHRTLHAAKRAAEAAAEMLGHSFKEYGT